MLISGVLGGLVGGILMKGGIIRNLVSACVGGITVTYLGDPLAQSPLNYWHLPAVSVGYIVGLTAMALCEGILRYAQRWAKNPALPGAAP